MKVLPVEALSVKTSINYIYALVKRGEKIVLQVLDENLKVIDELISLNGARGFILKILREGILVCVDNKLYLVQDGKVDMVLRASNPSNVFLHAIEVEGRVYVHEYGASPTKIFASEDLREWKAIVTNSDIDRSSKHFHSIAYDPYRRWLIATLGDGNLTRVAVSEDGGSTWKPLYKGPWQFFPILVLKDKLVFGMDSGIARGGIGIYNPNDSRWSFVFLRWHSDNVRFAQMRDLKLMDNSLYIAGLGTPQAIIVSKDAKTWYPVHIEGFDDLFNMHIEVNEGNGFVVCTTGRSLIAIGKDELDNLPRIVDPVMVSYTAYMERLIGLGFILRYKLSSTEF